MYQSVLVASDSQTLVCTQTFKIYHKDIVNDEVKNLLNMGDPIPLSEFLTSVSLPGPESKFSISQKCLCVTIILAEGPCFENHCLDIPIG